MDLQDQVDYLKRCVLSLQRDVNKLDYALMAFRAELGSPIVEPGCPECHIQMYDGAVCSHPASECPCGIGQKEE